MLRVAFLYQRKEIIGNSSLSKSTAANPWRSRFLPLLHGKPAANKTRNKLNRDFMEGMSIRLKKPQANGIAIQCTVRAILRAPRLLQGEGVAIYNGGIAKNVIHISEAEAARDFASRMARVRRRAEVVIENDAPPVAVVSPAEPSFRLLSEEAQSQESLDRACNPKIVETHSTTPERRNLNAA